MKRYIYRDADTGQLLSKEEFDARDPKTTVRETRRDAPTVTAPVVGSTPPAGGRQRDETMATSKTTKTTSKPATAPSEAHGPGEATLKNSAANQKDDKQDEAPRPREKAEIETNASEVRLHHTGASLDASEDMDAPVPLRADPYRDQRKNEDRDE